MLRELTSSLCSGAALAVGFEGRGLVWTLQKKEMRSLNLNLSLKAWIVLRLKCIPKFCILQIISRTYEKTPKNMVAQMNNRMQNV